MLSIARLCAILLALTIVPGVESQAKLGVEFDQSISKDLPVLNLPYARVVAKSYDRVNRLYVFKNIPFAAPPTGQLRWRPPQPPVQNSTVIDGSYGPKCVQTGIGNPTNIQDLGGGTQSEDCLYLDVYVPAPAIKDPNSRIPVIQYFYGGGYVFGEKNVYGGANFVETGGVVYVVSNYRVGAYGFLAGSTMEKEGFPNAGFWDQRAALNWTNQYINLLGGDRDQVTAMGESAGAAGVFHQITAFGGTQDPLFRRAILQSPAFDLRWDRRGALEVQFQNFAKNAGCEGKRLDCLRRASPEALKRANDAGASTPYKERSAYQPSADGGFVRQMAALELESGNYWKGIESIIISHCLDEAADYVDPRVQTNEDFDQYVRYYFPVEGVPEAIATQYPSINTTTKPAQFDTQSARLKAMIADHRFHCNVVDMAEALSKTGRTKVYNMVYAAPPYKHGADVLPTFFFPELIPNGTSTFVEAYRSLFTSLALTGDPNARRQNASGLQAPPSWPTVDTSGSNLANVLNITLAKFELIQDPQASKPTCDFWTKVAAALTDTEGYAPPGGEVRQDLLPQPQGSNVSSNFSGTNATGRQSSAGASHLHAPRPWISYPLSIFLFSLAFLF
ncbi:Alpha/Beta hydrolase protein [Phyllosticta citrichinensis]|uniref:Alpha/Beta hydrolase protein n=1 Tax=Phyllosticta citrichinensis TaxID=1130410 RepID=A0ABR1XHB4_9PEZI